MAITPDPTTGKVGVSVPAGVVDKKDVDSECRGRGEEKGCEGAASSPRRGDMSM